MQNAVTSFVLCAICVLAAHPVQAQNANCNEHAMVVERLASGYGETRQSIGLAANNTVVEVFASIDTGTWTITVTQAGGLTCLVASGEGYQQDPASLGDTPA